MGRGGWGSLPDPIDRPLPFVEFARYARPMQILTLHGIAPAIQSTTPLDRDRVDESGRRERLLDGTWLSDLEEFMSAHVEASRLKQWGPPNQALNLFKSLVKQLACLYDEEPAVRNPDFDEESEGFLMRLNLWPRMQHHSELVIGLRESAIRIEHTTETTEGINLRMVPSTMIEVECAPHAPTTPWLIREARYRVVGGAPEWCWDVFDIRNPEAPSYTIVTMERGLPVTEQVLGAEEAAKPYPWISPLTSKPFLPWVVYHAADRGTMWDYREWSELVHGTYLLATLWTFWTHALKEASWEQKYAIDLMLQGLQTKGKDAAIRSKVSVDATSMLMFKSKADADGRPTGGQVGAIGAAVDPLKMAEAILLFQQVVATHLGVAPSDIVTTAANEKSGIAISLTRSGLRRMQRRYKPLFKAGDEELLSKIAWVHSLFGDRALPTLPLDGYTVNYPALPLSPEEIEAILSRHEKLSAAGLESAVDLAMALDPSLSRKAAMEHIRMIAKERAEIARLQAQAATEVDTDGGDMGEVVDELEAAMDALTTAADDVALPDRLRALLTEALEGMQAARAAMAPEPATAPSVAA